MDFKARAGQIKKDIPAVFLALKHSRTPLLAKIIAALAVGYALSPIDLIPDFIPVLGLIDDIILLPALAALAIRLIPEDVMQECRANADGMWSSGKPKKWYYALPIVIIWFLMLWVIIKAVWFK